MSQQGIHSIAQIKGRFADGSDLLEEMHGQGVPFRFDHFFRRASMAFRQTVPQFANDGFGWFNNLADKVIVSFE
jgi:hypothetical protein